MLQPNHARAGGLAVRVLGSLAVLALLGAVMYFTIPNERALETGSKPALPKQSDKARRCEDHLADLIEGLNPGRLGISSDRGQIIDRINTWKSECGSVIGEARPSSDRELIEKLLTGEQLTRTLSDRYLAEDASQVRMSLLSRDIVANVVEGNTSNIDRAVSVFDFISRNVMLINSEIRDPMALTSYESLVFGLGTPEDRAWIFADLMRQIRTDVVILTPRTEGKAEHWLVGAIDPQAGVLLFDPRLGLPIPAAGVPLETPYPKVPATLQQVRESDAAFRQLDLPDSPYPLTSDDMADLSVSLIGTSSTWAPRMANLQYLLPQGLSVDLYDGLGANELRSPGALERVTQAGASGLWKPDQVGIWAWPEQSQAKYEATRGEGEPGSPLANFNIVFKGPYTLRPSGEDGKSLEPTPINKSLHFVRVEQLRGKYADAIRDYLPVRTTVNLVPSPANENASEFGTLWTAVCQYETQKIRTALGTFDRYIGMQAKSVGMTRSAVEYLADCLLTQKNYALAIDVLKKAPAGFAARRDAYLIRRWQELGGISPDATAPAEKDPAKDKADEKPAGEPAAGTEQNKPAPEAMQKPAADSEKSPAKETPSPAASPATEGSASDKPEVPPVPPAVPTPEPAADPAPAAPAESPK